MLCLLNKQTQTPNTPQNPNNLYFLLSSLKAVQMVTDFLLHFEEQNCCSLHVRW